MGLPNYLEMWIRGRAHSAAPWLLQIPQTHRASWLNHSKMMASIAGEQVHGSGMCKCHWVYAGRCLCTRSYYCPCWYNSPYWQPQSLTSCMGQVCLRGQAVPGFFSRFVSHIANCYSLQVASFELGRNSYLSIIWKKKPSHNTT